MATRYIGKELMSFTHILVFHTPRSVITRRLVWKAIYVKVIRKIYFNKFCSAGCQVTAIYMGAETGITTEKEKDEDMVRFYH